MRSVQFGDLGMVVASNMVALPASRMTAHRGNHRLDAGRPTFVRRA
jgi:hypothetical protein